MALLPAFEMSNALQSLKRSCSSVLRLWQVCLACTVVAGIALAVHISLSQDVSRHSKLTTSTLLSYVGLSSTTEQQALAFRAFPADQLQINMLLGTLYPNCLQSEQGLLEKVSDQRQLYR